MLDLLVSLATAAARSRRRAAVFGDFPHVPDPADPAGPAPLDPARPDWPALQVALERIPSVAELAAAGPGSRRVQEFVARRGEGRLGYDLAKWLAGTNRARLSMLVARPGQDHAGPLPAVATPFQYVVGAESAEKEEAFAARVAAAGGRSFLAWHGSPPENWHGILRSGLQARRAARGGAERDEGPSRRRPRPGPRTGRGRGGA